jgi:hypothetical protein
MARRPKARVALLHSGCAAATSTGGPRRQLQAHTLQAPSPVCVGEFLSAVTGEFDVPVPGGCPALEFEAVPAVTLDDEVPVPLRPGDCPGGMNGDCGVLVR